MNQVSQDCPETRATQVNLALREVRVQRVSLVYLEIPVTQEPLALPARRVLPDLPA